MRIPAVESRSPRDWAVDVVAFLLAVGFTALAYVDGVERRLDPAVLAVDAILGGLGCLGVWLRRRLPVGFAAPVIAFSVFSSAASGVALLALFTVAVHRRFAVVGLVTAGFAAASVGSVVVRPDVPLPTWPLAALGVVCVAAVLATGMFVRARRQLAGSLREQARRADLERVAQARSQERKRIAREMHDVLAHRMSLVSLHAGALELRPDAPAAEIARAAGVIRDSAHQALEDLREVIGVLRAEVDCDDDAPERPQPTLADLPALAEESRRAGTRVRLVSRVADPASVPPAIGRGAYRIVQEGLTNARKYAPGAEVSVSVHGGRGDGVTVEIRNPWPSDTEETAIPGAGSGIIGLAERAELAGGRLEHGHTSAGDFRLWAWLPWQP
ncbi:sensor histidine kinase [Actinokineospora xionganensis]|nr:histidine kinase [Actinokineospora xionganensis]